MVQCTKAKESTKERTKEKVTDDSTTASGTIVTKEKENKDERIQRQHPNWIWQSLYREKKRHKGNYKGKNKGKTKGKQMTDTCHRCRQLGALC